MRNAITIVRNADLKPYWGVLRAKEPGFLRSLITWIGGPAGCVNTNPEQAVESSTFAVGLMDMPVGNKQAGLHIHTVTEIYIILEGEVESIDGYGNRHRAGPMDCVYIPKGVPHGVRTLGDTDVKLMWMHDGIERFGTAVYLEGPGPHPADDEVSIISLKDLEPDWSAPRAKEAGFMRWNVSWVGSDKTGPLHNPSQAYANTRIGIRLSVIQPGNRIADEPPRSTQLSVVVRGTGLISMGTSTETLGRQDAVVCRPGQALDLRAFGDAPLYVVHVQDKES
jgi:mannose-6-phosphate isomerase-like protein (cupin superfamily)